MNKIIIFSGKHGDNIYDASTSEAVARACASELRERFNSGWFGEPSKPEPLSDENQSLVNTSPEILEGLPKSIGEPLLKKRARLIRDVRGQQVNYENELKEWEEIFKLVSAPSLEEAAAMTIDYTYTLSTKEVKTRVMNLAKWLIDGRSDFEYEDYSIEPLSIPKW